MMKGRTYPTVIFSAKVFRRPLYYIINVAVPMAIFSIISLVPFLVCGESTLGRQGFFLSNLLTAVAYKFVTVRMLPSVSYLTLIDQYLLALFLFIVLMMVADLIIDMLFGARAHNTMPATAAATNATAQTCDLWPAAGASMRPATVVLLVGIVCWLLVHVFFARRVWRILQERRRDRESSMQVVRQESGKRAMFYSKVRHFASAKSVTTVAPAPAKDGDGPPPEKK